MNRSSWQMPVIKTYLFTKDKSWVKSALQHFFATHDQSHEHPKF